MLVPFVDLLLQLLFISLAHDQDSKEDISIDLHEDYLLVVDPGLRTLESHSFAARRLETGNNPVSDCFCSHGRTPISIQRKADRDLSQTGEEIKAPRLEINAFKPRIIKPQDVISVLRLSDLDSRGANSSCPLWL